jgi:acyl-[acyl-carrier-protein] desaturase
VSALELDPSAAVLAINRQVRNFQMPGSAMPGFSDKAKQMAAAGIYNMRIHLEQVLTPVLMSHWKLTELDGLTDESEAARDQTVAFLARLDRVADRLEQPRGPAERAGHPDPRT